MQISINLLYLIVIILNLSILKAVWINQKRKNSNYAIVQLELKTWTWDKKKIEKWKNQYFVVLFNELEKFLKLKKKERKKDISKRLNF